MRILHLCLSNFYVDGFAYQENELVQQNIRDGHAVEVIASTEVIGDDGMLRYVPVKKYLGTDGAMVERIPYRKFLPRTIMAKLRMHPKLEKKIIAFEPDVILFHSACGWELNTVGHYIKKNPHVKFYVDSHEDFINSARNVISKWLLHWIYYRMVLQRNLKYITKILPVSVSALEFMRDFYGVPPEKLELYPLGGFVPDSSEYETLRERCRQKLGLKPGEILIVQSGKLDRTKKLLEALEAFRTVLDPELKFAIAGRLLPDIDEAVQLHAAEDPRITLLGWQSPEELRALLCAADVYCQPGTQSATMQMSIANRCAVILDDIPSHRPYMSDNGWLVGVYRSLQDAFADISNDKAAVRDRGNRSYEVALRLLDYRILAERLYRQQ